MAPAIEAESVPSPVWAGTGNAWRFPARARRCPVDPQVWATQRPAPDPAGAKRPPWAGRALAGGFGTPAGPDPGVVLWQGRWPLPMHRGRSLRPFGRGTGNATRVFPARARQCPIDREVREKQRPAPDPAGAKRPPWEGRALVCGLGPPAGPDPGAAPGQGRWPLPGGARRARANLFPALRSGRPCGRRPLKTPLTPGRSGWGCARGQAPRTHNR